MPRNGSARKSARIELHPTRVEDRPFDVDLGGIGPLAQSDVANVLRADFESADMKRVEGTLVLVGEVALGDVQAIDLEI